MSESTAATKKPLAWKRWLVIGVVALLAYFVNVEVQSHLGRKALEAHGLEPLALQEALQQAANSDKRVLVNMSAIWCPSCRKLDREVFADPAVQAAIANRYVFSRIEYESDDGEAFMERYGVKGFPTLLVLEPDGMLVRQLPVTFDPAEFASRLGG